MNSKPSGTLIKKADRRRYWPGEGGRLARYKRWTRCLSPYLQYFRGYKREHDRRPLVC